MTRFATISPCENSPTQELLAEVKGQEKHMYYQELLCCQLCFQFKGMARGI